MKQKGKTGTINGWGIVGLLLGAIVVLIVLVVVQNNLNIQQPETVLGILMAQVIVALMMLLFIMAAGFALLGLADPQQALGLPEGSIRAMIALFLIMIFVTFGLYLFRAVANTTDINQDAVDVAKQLINTVGTLVVAVAGFYFGSRAVQVARGVATPDEPKIRSIDPTNKEKVADSIDITIVGEGFMMADTVKLVKGKTEIKADEVISNASKIVAKFKIGDATLEKDDKDKEKETKFDLVVINGDGAEDRLVGAFTIKPISQPATPPAQPPATPPAQPPATPPAQPPVKPPTTPQA